MHRGEEQEGKESRETRPEDQEHAEGTRTLLWTHARRHRGIASEKQWRV